jgi:hypothetical protein
MKLKYYLLFIIVFGIGIFFCHEKVFTIQNNNKKIDMRFEICKEDKVVANNSLQQPQKSIGVENSR